MTAQGFSNVFVGQTPLTLSITGVGTTQVATQAVVAGDGGLNLNYADNPNYGVEGDAPSVLYVGGGTNDISFANSQVAANIYLAGGNNTIVAGDGATTIDGGPDASSIDAGSGSTLIEVTGSDTINLGSGAATVRVANQASAEVFAGSGKLLFIGGVAASTVVGGNGAETIYAGQGGGQFSAGSVGTNDLVGATAPTTVSGNVTTGGRPAAGRWRSPVAVPIAISRATPRVAICLTRAMRRRRKSCPRVRMTRSRVGPARRTEVAGFVDTSFRFR